MVKAKILIIDDSDLVLESARASLEEAGFQVVTLKNPLRAAIVARTERPDLILIDVRMPDASGDVMASILERRNPGSNAPPIVLFSDLSVSELKERARMCHAAGFISKSAGPDGLVSSVKELLRIS